MNKLLIILGLVITAAGCQVELKGQSFDKEKWRTSGDYRYEISKTSDFPDLKGKSKKYVKRLLGEPDEVNGEKFIYCFDINANTYYDNKLGRKVCDCKASFVIIDFKIDERWRTTFSWVELSSPR